MSVAWFGTAPVIAQESIHPGDMVRVYTISTHEVLRGIVIDSTRNGVTVDIHGYRVDVPLRDVHKIDLEVEDSPLNGALIGAAFLGVLCALTCGQDLEDGAEHGEAVLLAATAGALIGGHVDGSVGSLRTVYRQPGQPRPSALRRAVPLLTFRF